MWHLRPALTSQQWSFWYVCEAFVAHSRALSPQCSHLQNGSVVVIGGHDGTGPRNDTWFTNDTDTYESWYSLDTADGSVEFIPRSGHAAVVVRKVCARLLLARPGLTYVIRNFL